MKKIKVMLLAVVLFFYEALYSFHWRSVMPKMCLFLTPEEQAEMDRLKAENEKLMKDLDDATKPKPKDNEPPAEPGLEEKARKNAEEKARIDAENKKIENAVKFEYEIQKIITDSGDIIGDEIKGIIDVANQRAYPNTIEKANEIKAAILNKFFSTQANIDALLVDSLKTKATDFLKLTQIKRNELADTHFELFEIAIANIKREKKHEQLVKQNAGLDTSDKGIAYEKKIFSLRDNKAKKGE